MSPRGRFPPRGLLVGLLAGGLASAASPSLPASQELDLPAAGFDRGEPQAPILVVEFGDFGCSACAQFATEVWAAVDAEFVATGKVRWKFVPFVLGAFRHSQRATAAALCAARQDAFWPMHDRLYREQAAWSAARSPDALFRNLASQLGLDTAQFDRCYRDPETAGQVRQLTRLARRLSINATPTFLVGERRIRGALPLASFRQVLAEAARP